jgi:hypothetical protein
MSKMIRVNVLVLLTLVLSYGGIATPGYSLLQCPSRFCNDVPDFCDVSPEPGCFAIKYVYIGDCEEGPVYRVDCAACRAPYWHYCYYSP